MGDGELAELLDLITADRLEGVLVTPRLIYQMLSHLPERLAAAGQSLRYMLANATPMHRERIVELLRLLPDLRFVTYYGMTEASRSLFNLCREHPGEEHATGAPTSGVEARLLDPDPDTGIGEMLVRGPNVVPGYWGGESPVDAEGWLHTGDLARRLESGVYQVLSRINDAISIDGLKVLPSELEPVLLSHPEVTACAVVGIEDAETWQRLGVAVVPREGFAEPERFDRLAHELLALCRQQLSSFKVPKQIHFFERLPTNEFGKVLNAEVIRQITSAPGSWPKSQTR